MNSGFLLDTSVLSLLAPGRPTPDADLAAWIKENNDRLFISAVTVAEVEQGICKLRRASSNERAEALAGWLDSLLDDGGDRILSLDANVGRIAGGLSDKATAIGRHPGFADVAIAATAVAHALTIVTRNGRHFAPLNVAFVDPIEKLPGRQESRTGRT